MLQGIVDHYIQPPIANAASLSLHLDLAGPALSVRAFAGRAPSEFGWFEAPEAAALERADELLTRLGAIGLKPAWYQPTTSTITCTVPPVR